MSLALLEVIKTQKGFDIIDGKKNKSQCEKQELPKAET